MSLASQKITVFEKVGYSLGDFAANLVFQTLITYLAYFYTDIYGLKKHRCLNSNVNCRPGCRIWV